MIAFKDGPSLDLSGPLRVELHEGQYYVLGDGIYLPVDDEASGLAFIGSVESKEVFMRMKLFKSAGARARVSAVLDEVAAEAASEAAAKAAAPAEDAANVEAAVQEGKEGSK